MGQDSDQNLCMVHFGKTVFLVQHGSTGIQDKFDRNMGLDLGLLHIVSAGTRQHFRIEQAHIVSGFIPAVLAELQSDPLPSASMKTRQMPRNDDLGNQFQSRYAMDDIGSKQSLIILFHFKIPLVEKGRAIKSWSVTL